ncbi:MAG: hypothetical protein AAF840_17865, partial [Bacteroidota bacterium]
LEGAIRHIDDLMQSTTDLQNRINSGDLSVQNAEPELTALKNQLRDVTAGNEDVSKVIDIGLNRSSSTDGTDGVSVTQGLADLAVDSRRITDATTRFVTTDDGDIIPMDILKIPQDVRIGQTFTVDGRTYTYMGDPHQRALIEEGFDPGRLRNAGERAAIQASHDMGVERGRMAAEVEGIEIIDMNFPNQYLGLYGRGMDDVGTLGGVFYILEWKGGASSLGNTRHGRQMSAEWVGTKLAEFNFYHDTPHDVHDQVRQLLNAAQSGNLRGRGYSTQWNDTKTAPLPTRRMTAGPLAGGEATYNITDVFAAFVTRTQELANQHDLPFNRGSLDYP